MKYKFLKHTADVKFQSYGETLEKAFENAALALRKTIAEDIKVKPVIKKKIIIEGKDKENLLYNFLEEFLFLLDSEDFLFNEISKIKIKNNKLAVEINGDLASKYSFTNDVKAITYNEMFVKKGKFKGKDKFICQVVLDV